eukprot:sb/3479080/
MRFLILIALVGLSAAGPCEVCKTAVQSLKDVMDSEIVCEDKANAVIDFVAHYIANVDSNDLCSKLGNCDQESAVELVRRGTVIISTIYSLGSSMVN